MPDIKETKKLLDEINSAIASYDPVLREQAKDILLKQAFGTDPKGSKSPPLAKDPAPAAGTPPQIVFHQLVEKWEPATQAEWALLGAYFYQVILANDSITAFQVNKELKQHGAVIANITMSFEENINQNPALMRQIGKSGKSKQAKKKYIVTTNGITFVKDKLNAQAQS